MKQCSGGIGFAGLLAIVFITLKLMGYIASWSWLWVLSPIWIPLALVLFSLILGMIGAILLYKQSSKKWKKRR